MNIIQQLEKEQADKLEAIRPIPEFGPGDTVRIIVKIHEMKAGAGRRTGSKNQKGGKSKDKREAKDYRTQAFEGVCIARSGGGINESFTVRKISYGEGVERVFPIYSPNIEEIQVLRRGRVRRAKLYYLRGLRGKSARIAEKKDYTKKK